MPLVFKRPALIQFNGNNLTDHNRSPLTVDSDRIEFKTRLASGRLRNYYVADKHRFSIDWTFVPSSAANTVDGFWGAADMKNFYDINQGESFELRVVEDTGEEDIYEVMFESFDMVLVNRWEDEYWDVIIDLEEV